MKDLIAAAARWKTTRKRVRELDKRRADMVRMLEDLDDDIRAATADRSAALAELTSLVEKLESAE